RFTRLPSEEGRMMALVDKGAYAKDLSLLANTDDTLRFYVGAGIVATSAHAVTAERWHHVVGTFRANGWSRIYVDGELQGQTAFGVAREPDVQPLKLGDGAYFTQRWLNGALDEIAVWSEELSGDHVRLLYARGLAHQPLLAR